MDYVLGRRPASDLSIADIWTPERPEDQKLARTVVAVSRGPGGEVVEYWLTRDQEYDIHWCNVVTFRQWISKMRCVRSVDEEYLEELRSMA